MNCYLSIASSESSQLEPLVRQQPPCNFLHIYTTPNDHFRVMAFRHVVIINLLKIVLGAVQPLNVFLQFFVPE